MSFSVSKQFTDTPGPRYRKQGRYSGEEFRDSFLEPLLEQYISTGRPIEINLDGVYGYPTSFLEEAFGGLARAHSIDVVQKAFTYVAKEQPGIVEEIQSDILNANAR